MRIVIVGGGFDGVWATIAAVEERARHGGRGAPLDIKLVSRDPWLTVRPRLYERSLDGVRVSLDSIVGTRGVDRLQGDVTRIDWLDRRLIVATRSGPEIVRYDRLVLAAGSELNRPTIPGIDLAFDVDTFAQAEALDRLRANASLGQVAAGLGTGRAAQRAPVERRRHFVHRH